MKKIILGIDEVGRGPWAGPLVVGAVVLGEAQIDGLTDSKKLSRAKRERLASVITETLPAGSIGLGWVEAKELDEIGLSNALRLATRRAVAKITSLHHEIIIDGTINFLSQTNREDFVTLLKKADLLIPEVSAASIVAKVARDKFMQDLAKKYPQYGFDSNSGYGTLKHRQAIADFGVTAFHRLSFTPLKKYADNSPVQPKAGLTTKEIGDVAEDLVKKHLQAKGFEIILQNWRTKNFEIDLIAKKGDKIHFIEVKYRKNDDFGGGVAVINAKKLAKMHLAQATFFSQNEEFSDFDSRVMIASVSNQPAEIIELIEV